MKVNRRKKMMKVNIMMCLVYLILAVFNLGEQELITWSGVSSDDWDDSEKLFHLHL